MVEDITETEDMTMTELRQDRDDNYDRIILDMTEKVLDITEINLDKMETVLNITKMGGPLKQIVLKKKRYHIDGRHDRNGTGYGIDKYGI